MNKRFISLLAIALIITLAISCVGTTFAVYVDEEDNTYYGWTLVCPPTDYNNFHFDDDGNVQYIYAAEGDTGTQRVNNYAIRDLSLTADEEYTVQATFVPDAETDLSAERAYGLLLWYQDSNNYLIYWMQQKIAGDWSGQLYGRVDGIIRTYLTSAMNLNEADNYWRMGEFYDLWWDNSTHSNPNLLGVNGALCDTTITLKVVSKIETITVDGTSWTGRSYELHQIVDGADHISAKFYIKNIYEKGDGFNVGIYSEAFSFEVQDFTLTCETDFADKVETQISALPTIESADDIAEVNDARVEYENLLELKSEVSQESVDALVAKETEAAAYIDQLINDLDESERTFADDVSAVYTLYDSYSSFISSKVTKTTELTQAVVTARDWVYSCPEGTHQYTNGVCSQCGEVCEHEAYTNGTCNECGTVCTHEAYTNGTCDECGTVCAHTTYTNGICAECGVACTHNYVEGVCTICGQADPDYKKGVNPLVIVLPIVFVVLVAAAVVFIVIKKKNSAQQ